MYFLWLISCGLSGKSFNLRPPSAPHGTRSSRPQTGNIFSDSSDFFALVCLLLDNSDLLQILYDWTRVIIKINTEFSKTTTIEEQADQWSCTKADQSRSFSSGFPFSRHFKSIQRAQPQTGNIFFLFLRLIRLISLFLDNPDILNIFNCMTEQRVIQDQYLINSPKAQVYNNWRWGWSVTKLFIQSLFQWQP